MNILKAFLDVLFPPKCIFCGKILDARERETRICLECRRALPYNETVVENRPRSERAGERGGIGSADARGGAGSTGVLSDDSVAPPPDLPDGRSPRGSSLDRVCAPLRYDGRVRDALLRYKFGDRKDYAEPLGRFVADEARRRYRGEFDLISYAPISAKRLKKRGYDQARLLAEVAAAELGVECAQTLEKVRDTAANSSLDAQKRAKNVENVYAVVDAELVAGKRILLVDDIYTTGATMHECARTLRAAGAASVLGIAVAMAQKAEKE